MNYEPSVRNGSTWDHVGYVTTVEAVKQVRQHIVSSGFGATDVESDHSIELLGVIEIPTNTRKNDPLSGCLIAGALVLEIWRGSNKDVSSTGWAMIQKDRRYCRTVVYIPPRVPRVEDFQKGLMTGMRMHTQARQDGLLEIPEVVDPLYPQDDPSWIDSPGIRRNLYVR